MRWLFCPRSVLISLHTLSSHRALLDIPLTHQLSSSFQTLHLLFLLLKQISPGIYMVHPSPPSLYSTVTFSVWPSLTLFKLHSS